jgi:hypothetical protein
MTAIASVGAAAQLEIGGEQVSRVHSVVSPGDYPSNHHAVGPDGALWFTNYNSIGRAQIVTRP